MVLTLDENPNTSTNNNKKNNNGFSVQSLDPNGLIYQDGRIVVGDYIVALNGKELRFASSSHVQAIIQELELNYHNNDNNELM